MNNQQKLSIVVPCFNESKNVVLVIKEFQRIFIEKPEHFEVIVVDGHSSDDTAKVLTKLFTQLDSNYFKLILMNERNGYGHDIIHGLNQATGTTLAWTHADMQTDLNDVFKAYDLFKAQKEKKCFIKGKRKNRRLLETFFSFGMQIVTMLVLKTYLDDINAQPKVFSRDFFNKFLKDNSPNDFSLDLYAVFQAKKNGYNILSIPVFFADRIHGEAKGGGGSWKNKINLIKRTFKYILKLKKILL